MGGVSMRTNVCECCGVVRSDDSLREGLRRLDEIRDSSGDVDVSPSAEGYADLAHVLDLRGALLVGEATVLGALERGETRGAHIRADYPDQDPELLVNLVVALRDGRPELTRTPVPPVPDQLRGWADATEPPPVSGRLLE